MPGLGEDVSVLKDLLENATYGLAALETLVDDLESRLTAGRATNLDNLDVKLSDFYDQWDPRYKVYPANAAGVRVTASTTGWAYGSWAEIVPPNTITEAFWIVRPFHTARSTGTLIGILDIGIGASGSEVVVLQEKGGAMHISGDSTGRNPLAIPAAANSRVAGRFANSTTAAAWLDVSILYITGL